MTRARNNAVCCVLLLICCAGRASAQQFDPAYRFNVLTTDHFRIHFHQGEEALAPRLAVIVEDVWQQLSTTTGHPAPARTEVILVDQTDLANGWATPVPRNIIAIYAVWPAGSDTLKTDDWLRLVFTHEFTHIVQLDRSVGWAHVARRIFGRIPIAFPNLFLPAWQIEGLAVYEESALTGDGRLHAGDFRAVVGEAARTKSLQPIDRASGGLIRWPDGGAHYAYGATFHAFLSERYGADKLESLAEHTAGGIPYLGSLAFKSVYDKSLGALWREFEDAQLASAAPAPASDLGRRLTHHNFQVSGPRFAGDTIYYSVQDADDWPSLYRVRPGESAPKPEKLTMRMLGSTLGVGRDRLYFDQLQLQRNAGFYSDLYSFDPLSRAVRRLTDEARLIDPDLAPDGHSLVAVQVRPGRRDLVTVPLAGADRVGDIRTLHSGAETQFNAPRWSPDGRTIAVEIHPIGELPKIVLVDPSTGAMRPLVGDGQSRWTSPAWRPDGQAVVAAAALGDDPFNLYEITVADGRIRQLTQVSGGATWPDVSADGSKIAFVGQTATGYDLYEIPYPQPSATRAVALNGAPRPARPASPAASTTVPARPYSPWPTLAPTSWFPRVDSAPDRFGIGAEVFGQDVLGYHNYSASVLQWLVTSADAPDRRAITDWDLSYAYSRWRMSPFISSSRDTSFLVAAPAGDTEIGRETLQETDVEAGVALPINRVRTTQIGLASFLYGTRRTTIPERAVDATRAATRFGWSFYSAPVFGYSVSPERGLTAGLTAELVRKELGADADATTLTADVRAYLPGARPHHVIALRAAAGRTTGDITVGRRFVVGGADANSFVMDFGSEAMSLLRGFPSGSFAGTRVALVNADYRFPMFKIERGRGTWPVFLQTIHGAVFADLANVWNTTFASKNLKSSVGAEISMNGVLGYFFSLTATAGVARGHDGSGRLRDQTTWYARLGYAF